MIESDAQSEDVGRQGTQGKGSYRAPRASGGAERRTGTGGNAGQAVPEVLGSLGNLPCPVPKVRSSRQ